MQMIKVLIVDDSAFVRKVVREMLNLSPEIEVVGAARNGEDALQMVESLNPDVVTCDLTMPELSGVEFVKRQMRRKPLPILVLTASAQDAEQVLDALQAGAVEFIQKPTALASEDLRSVAEDLIDKIKMAAQATYHSAATTISQPPVAAAPRSKPAKNVDIVVLGISTGGPQALRYMMPQFAPDFPVPLVIVLHMPVGYTALFAEKLAEISRLPVKEAYQGCPVRAKEALLAPAGRHLSFQRTEKGQIEVRLSLQPNEKPHRPSVDIMFKSASEVFRQRVLGVVMTGMGNDGTEGAACIKAQGGMVLTESEESCIIYGMPRSVVEAGLSDGSASLTSMAEEISKRL
jgi:two-component system, chemotaxis family, protein-glutamate methylesterase/glutaminase